MQSLNHALPGALAELLRAAPLSPGKVTFAWNAVVGAALRRVTSVRLESGQLIVDAPSGAWAREVARAEHLILPRLQAMLGRETVTSIRVRSRNA